MEQEAFLSGRNHSDGTAAEERSGTKEVASDQARTAGSVSTCLVSSLNSQGPMSRLFYFPDFVSSSIKWQ